MNEIHALSGAYAIDALDDIERAQFERHLADCAECRAEVDSLREAAALLPETTTALPSDALRERVLAGITQVRPLPPLPVEAPARRRARFRPAALVAAAAAVIAVGAGAVVWEPWEDQASQAPSLVASDVLGAPDAEEYVQEFPDGSKATLVRSKSLNRAVVVTSNMAPAPEGKLYELWLNQDGVMVPAGLMPSGADATVMLSGDAASAEGAGITIEPAPDGSETPSGNIVAVIPFENV